MREVDRARTEGSDRRSCRGEDDERRHRSATRDLSLRRLAHELGPPLAGIAALIAVWAAVAALTTSDVVPSPLEVWQRLRRRHGRRLDPRGDPEDADPARVLVRASRSWSARCSASALALNEFARRSIRPLVVALQIVPFVAWVPIAVIWFGATERAVVFVAIVGSFPSMTLATIAAMRQVPPHPEARRAARSAPRAGRCTARSSCRPRCPGFIAGLQQAWGFAWKALMAGELIIAAAGAAGLGHLLAQEADDVPALLASSR